MPTRPGPTIERRLPDVYPPVHNLSDRWERNENFVGREDDICRIYEILRGRGVAVVRSKPSLPVAGKTATAVEYAHRYHLEYDVIWVFDYQAPLGLAAEHAQLDRIVREKGIAGGRRWLLVFDGVDGEPAGFRRWYPDTMVDLLFTTRQPGGEGDELSVTLGRLGYRHSALLLNMIAPMVGPPWGDILVDRLAGQPALLWEVGQLIAAGAVTPHTCARLLTMLLPPDGSGTRPTPDDLRVPPPVDPVDGVRGRIALHELTRLAELLEDLDFMADLTSRRTWFTLVEERFGQPIRLPDTSYIRTLMINLLRFAIEQPTSDALVAIVVAAEALGPGDPNVGYIRAAVSSLCARLDHSCQ